LGYLIQEGDVLNIKLYYNPELNEVVPVRPDGKISLQLIDDVGAAGLTPEELDKILTVKFARTLKNPELTVIVEKFSGQKVYVGGEVVNPQVVTLDGNMTLLQIILMAGGFKETAFPGNVIVLSKGADNVPIVRQIDLDKVISGESPENDITVHPFDIIYVPKTAIANANKFVDQYINNIVPKFINAGFSYTLYRGKQFP